MFEKKGILHKIDIHLRKNKTKGIAIDGVPIRKASELFGLIHFVFFSPEDLSIIKNGPGRAAAFFRFRIMVNLNKSIFISCLIITKWYCREISY